MFYFSPDKKVPFKKKHTNRNSIHIILLEEKGAASKIFRRDEIFGEASNFDRVILNILLHTQTKLIDINQLEGINIPICTPSIILWVLFNTISFLSMMQIRWVPFT